MHHDDRHPLPVKLGPPRPAHHLKHICDGEVYIPPAQGMKLCLQQLTQLALSIPCGVRIGTSTLLTTAYSACFVHTLQRMHAVQQGKCDECQTDTHHTRMAALHALRPV